MTEPGSNAPEERADVDDSSANTRSPELHLDRDKVEAWDEVKSDYEVEPGGEPVPNSMDPIGDGPIAGDPEEETPEDEGDR